MAAGLGELQLRTRIAVRASGCRTGLGDQSAPRQDAYAAGRSHRPGGGERGGPTRGSPDDALEPPRQHELSDEPEGEVGIVDPAWPRAARTLSCSWSRRASQAQLGGARVLRCAVVASSRHHDEVIGPRRFVSAHSSGRALPVRPQRFQHREPHRPTRWCRRRAAIDRRDGSPGRGRRARTALGEIDRDPSGAHRELAEGPSLVGEQHVVAPRDRRLQPVVAVGHAARRLTQEPEAVVEPADDLEDRQRLRSCRGELIARGNGRGGAPAWRCVRGRCRSRRAVARR